jgi:hypothetical protein
VYAHGFLFNISTSIQLVATLVTIDLLIWFGVCGTPSSIHTSLYERILILAGVIAVVLQLIGSSLQLGLLEAPLVLRQYVGLIPIVVILMITSALVLFKGTLFVYRLTSSYTPETKDRMKTLARPIKWIIMCGLFQYGTIMALMLSIDTAFLTTPQGFNLIYSLLYYSLTIGGFAHTVAFRTEPLGVFGPVVGALRTWHSSRRTLDSTITL